jgi:Ca-activated chloride channel family protein
VKTAPLVALLAISSLTVPARWLHNPRERTATAIGEWKRKDYQDADRHLTEALALSGESARALFNAGTGRLGDDAPGAAVPLLGRAAVAAGKDQRSSNLRPETLYNLGNAYLAADDTTNAIESYESALRLAPGHAAAKHNLELALQRRQQQQQEQQKQRQPQQPQKGNQGQGGGNGEQQKQPSGGDQQDQNQPPSPPDPQQQQRSPRLPSFNPQKDMSAEQAAALLEAVENLEREQRREQAERDRQARAQKPKDKDW